MAVQVSIILGHNPKCLIRILRLVDWIFLQWRKLEIGLAPVLDIDCLRSWLNLRMLFRPVGAEASSVKEIRPFIVLETSKIQQSRCDINVVGGEFGLSTCGKKSVMPSPWLGIVHFAFWDTWPSHVEGHMCVFSIRQ